MSLKEQLAEYRTGWYQRVPAERQAIMERHIEHDTGQISPGRHSQPPFVSGRSISGIWRPYKKSKRPQRESVRVGRSSASAVLLSVAPRGRPGRPCGGGGREDRLSSVLPELICYRPAHSPVPCPNSGMRSLGGRTWTQAALQARRSIDAQH
jgi:hypothetical protein